MKKYLTLLIAIAFTIQIKGQCTFGNYPPTYTAVVGWTNGMWTALKFTLSAPSTVSGFGLKSGSGSNGYRMALYTDVSNKPGNLVAASLQGTMGLGQNTLSATTPTLIPSGNYWITVSYQYPSAATTSSYVPTTTNVIQSGTLTNLPASLSTWTTGGNYSEDIWVILSPPTLTVSGNNSLCLGSSLTLTASGANTYSWNTGPTTNSISITPTSNTVFTVTGTSVPGCTNTISKSITVNPLPLISTASSNSVLCIGQTATLTSNGAVTYTWSPGGNGTTIIISPTITTTYSVTGEDINGCTNTTSITQTVNACAGIQNLTNNSFSILLTPNPTSGVINIDLTNVDSETTLKVFNSIGQQIVFNEVKFNSTKVDLSDYANGLYYVIVQSKGDRKIIKLLKQ